MSCHVISVPCRNFLVKWGSHFWQYRPSGDNNSLGTGVMAKNYKCMQEIPWKGLQECETWPALSCILKIYKLTFNISPSTTEKSTATIITPWMLFLIYIGLFLLTASLQWPLNCAFSMAAFCLTVSFLKCSHSVFLRHSKCRKVALQFFPLS